MAVLKRAKTLQASVLKFLKKWLAKLLAEDSVSESRLEEVHAFLRDHFNTTSARFSDL